MRVIVDTCIWSLALRRNMVEEKNAAIISKLKELICDSLVQVIGPIRQELLSGISSLEQFKKLRDYLAAFEDLELKQEDYELAAELYNTCKQKGIQGSNTDFIICAASIKHHAAIFTVDKDFTHYAQCLPIFLWGVDNKLNDYNTDF